MRRFLVALIVALAVLAASSTTAFADDSVPVQAATQSADTSQGAIAGSSATQVEPSNQNISVRVLSPGDNGAVTQSNDASSSANASNDADTKQSADQSQSGSSCGCSGSDGGVQASQQDASTDQTALAASSATQIDPSNSNISVRVLSPGDNGSVNQSNSASSEANASNDADTHQSASQDQGSGSGGVQDATQKAETDQGAAALSSAKQIEPSNSNISVRVLSKGDDGKVTQSNDASSEANASNDANTKQSVDQYQGGSSSCGCHGSDGGVQASKQNASTDQAALAASSATQIKPSNSNISVRVLSPGDNGSVSQSNSASSEANASNDASTHQSVSQDPRGGGSADQAATQKADTEQLAVGLSSAKQIEPSNSNDSVRVLSKGDDGKVKQSNDVSSEANASNDASTKQSVDQDQGGSSCGCHGSGGGVQASSQDASTEQAALAASSAEQKGAENSNNPVRIWSKGDGGSVSQSNSASSEANASNDADTHQSASQDQGSGSGDQVAIQKADTEQLAVGLSSAKQIDPSNSNDSVRVGSKGDDGKVKQSNDVSSEANASNDADTKQSVDQNQGGSSCGCQGSKDQGGSSCGCGSDGLALQVAGQDSSTEQGAIAASSAEQKGAENSNSPVRIWSKGDDGSVRQSNDVSSEANASNDADTRQSVDQDQGGSSCGCHGSDGLALQVAGQESETDQGALALSSAEQKGAENSNNPVRIGSKGDGGSVRQSNDVSSSADASNEADTTQRADQDLSGGKKCGCEGGLGIQAAGQSSSTEQLAGAASEATQVGAENSNAPVRIWSKGDDGSVKQSNDVSSDANASNDADTSQHADQDLSGSGIQALGQESETDQGAFALSSAEQLPGRESKCGCGSDSGNSAGPIRIGSPGKNGSLRQSNSVSSSADASNDADTTQKADQHASGSCKCGGLGIQVLGQKAKTGQLSLALSSAKQVGASNKSNPVSIGSYGKGGKTKQSNDASSDASSSNDASTRQHGHQLLI
jgi:hypothetical protein